MRHWTPAERQRQSEIIKQWQPWTRSTGARTPEGTARAIAAMQAGHAKWLSDQYAQARNASNGSRYQQNTLGDF